MHNSVLRLFKTSSKKYSSKLTNFIKMSSSATFTSPSTISEDLVPSSKNCLCCAPKLTPLTNPSTDCAIKFTKSTESLTEFVISLNAKQSAMFSDAGARLLRRAYRGKHPTQLIALKCMDGRLNLNLMTETPVGIIQPFRNIGGRFDIGWPFFGEIINESIEAAVRKGNDTIVFVTYHYSKGDPHRGCAGFGYNTDKAHKQADMLQKQFESVFGRTVVFPIVIGIETDDEAIVFQGENNEIYDVSENLDASSEDIHGALIRLYPDMLSSIRDDLLPLIMGNQRYVKKIRKQIDRLQLLELDHSENIIGVGRGFSWLHLPNRALLIGPYGHEWPEAVNTAGKIVLSNMSTGRVNPLNGVLLLVSALAYAEKGSAKWRVCEEKARYLERIATETLLTNHPELKDKLSVLCGVVDASTMLYHPLAKKV